MRKRWMGYLLLFMLVKCVGIQAAEKKLHVQVDLTVTPEFVEQRLTKLNHGPVHEGKLTLPPNQNKGTILAIVQGLKNSKENEFMTLDSNQAHMRIGRVGENLVIQGSHEGKGGEELNLTIPFAVIEAFISTGTNEVDLLRAFQTLMSQGSPIKLLLASPESNVRITAELQ